MRLWGIPDDLFAALYKSTLRRWNGDAETASFMTAVGLGGAILLNIGLGIGVIVAIRGPFAPAPKWMFYVPALALILLCQLAFVRHGRFRRLLARFEQRSDADQRRLQWGAWTYIVASYVLPLAFAVVMAMLTTR
jgi:hypothetical protein